MSNNPRHLRPRLTRIDGVIRYFAQKRKREKKEVYALQIGANDGITDDPIHYYIKKEGWKALLVEPQPQVFENDLKVTYADAKNVQFENVALGRVQGELPFYQLSFTQAKWATGLSSFVKGCLEAHIRNGYVKDRAALDGIVVPEKGEYFIEEVKVKVDTFANILKRNGFRRVDLLCIDTEGFDYQVLKLFDFNFYAPELVLFESKNLSDVDFIKAKALLAGFGYSLYWQKGNTLAVRFKIPRIDDVRFWLSAFLQKV
jgi:FkbM family methyltransferase